jgi:hypothetical protein
MIDYFGFVLREFDSDSILSSAIKPCNQVFAPNLPRESAHRSQARIPARCLQATGAGSCGHMLPSPFADGMTAVTDLPITCAATVTAPRGGQLPVNH